VEWQAPSPLPDNLAQARQLTFDAAGRLVPRATAEVVPPTFPSQCAASVRVDHDTAGPWYAVWWALRPDSTADVVVSHSADGRSWDPPHRVDSLDVGATGCRRPPPSIYVDGDNIHVAYAMAAREGPGIFASHSMDRGMTFHSPVPIVYGENPGLAVVAAHGNTVAVAYEDPNTNPRRIGVAISRTLGHIFEDRETVSPPTGAARSPGVAVSSSAIVVTWQPASADGTASTSTSPLMRRGIIR
jgi:hypothetical protein